MCADELASGGLLPAVCVDEAEEERGRASEVVEDEAEQSEEETEVDEPRLSEGW